MTLDELEQLSPEELMAKVKKAGGQRPFARKHGIPRTTLQNHLYKARKDPFSHRPAPEPTEVADDFSVKAIHRYILTSAQDSTVLHEQFLTNLEAYCEFLTADDASCELMIAGFTYGKSLFEDHSKKGVHWPSRIVPYMVNERVSIGGKVHFCGEMNTLPTAEAPLSGFEAYTHDKWGIFPHAKIQALPVATMKHAPAKMMMTTGACTLPNYVHKKAGLKASFHHCIGAVLVEIDAYGRFFCRHLIADEDDGSFFDLDRFVFNGEVTEGNRIRALTPGDVHVAQVDPEVSAITFGIAPTEAKHEEFGRIWEQAEAPSMLDVLQPEYLFIHDVCDFRSRNHHNIGDAHDRFRLHIAGAESVEEELAEVAFFLDSVKRPDTKVVVVESNHDLALNKWLNTADYRLDPVNGRFFLQCQLAVYSAIERGDDRFSIFEHVCTEAFEEFPCEDIRFLRQDESFVVDQVEMCNHGHNGANGSRGNIKQFAKIAPKVTVGHSHSAGINGGAYQTGTSTKMDMGYNKGASSWSHTHVIQYANGKRTLVTLNDGAWRL